MRASDRKLKAYFADKLPPDTKGWQTAAVRGRRAFADREAQGSLSPWEFLYQQGRYIQKRWWLLQGGVLLLLWWVLYTADSSVYVQKNLGVAAPLFALLLLPELWKNRSANALEVEGAAFYSLRQVYAARLLLFALVDLVLLSTFFLAAAWVIPVGPAFFLHFFLPFNVTCCICFRTLYSHRFGSQTFALLLCVLWTGLWLELSMVEAVYDKLSAPVWGGLLGLSLVYLGHCVVRGQKNLSKLWEGKPAWN